MSRPTAASPAAINALSQGLALLQRRDFAAAVQAFQTAGRLQRNYWEAHANCGLALKMLGRFAEAVEQFKLALKGAPQNAELLGSLANVHHLGGQPDEAAKLYRRALSLNGDVAGLRISYGTLLLQNNRPADALPHLARAHELDPHNLLPGTLLGHGLAQLGRHAEAVSWLERAADRPDAERGTLTVLASSLYADRRPQEAEAVARRLTAAAPDDVSGWRLLGAILRDMGQWREARDAHQREWEISGDPVALAKKALVLPMIPDGPGHLAEAREGLRRELAELAASGLRLPLERLEELPNAFLLSYHGLGNRQIQQDIAAFYRAACPDLTVTDLRPRPARRRIKVGFVSAHFHQHTIGQLFAGVIEQLPRDRFEVVLFLVPRGDDPLRRRLLKAADKAVLLPDGIAAARQAIAAEALDILHYPDIGLSPLTYFLAFARLAPVQCVSWGHPETTGLDSMDYFLSCAAMEPPGAEAHYGETLAAMAGTTVCYDRPDLPQQADRGEFGLPAGATLYGCAQTLFKFHPDFDRALAAILARDANGVLVLISDIAPSVNTLLRARLEAAGVPGDRLVFVPRQSRGGFLRLQAACDVLLDPLHYSGGNTSLEAFAAGKPIVTWPGAFMRGRHTHGFYRLMAVEECVARDHDHYVELAVRLGTDPAWRAEISARILAAAPVLYGDPTAAAELARVFTAITPTG